MNNYIKFRTILNKETNRFLRIWIQTLIPPLLNTTLYLMIFSNIIKNNLPYAQNFSYIEYIIPGLILTNAINNSYSNVSFSLFNDRYYGNIEEIITAPISANIVILGYIFGGIIRGFLISIISSIVISLIYKCYIKNYFFTFLILLLSNTVFSLLGFIIGISSSRIDNINLVLLILNPLIYLGGVFYSINLSNNFLQNLSKSNPIFYLVNTFRYYYIGLNYGYNNIYTIIILLLTICILFIIANIILKNRSNIKL